MKKSTKIITAILSVAILLSFLYKDIVVLTFMILWSPGMIKILGLSLVILFLCLIYLVYKYFIVIIKAVKENKKKKAIIMIIIASIIFITSLVVKFLKNDQIKNIFLYSSYIIGVVLIPLIMTWISMLKKHKNKSVAIRKIGLVICISSIIYFVNFPMVYSCAGKIIEIVNNNTSTNNLNSNSTNSNLGTSNNEKNEDIKIEGNLNKDIIHNIQRNQPNKQGLNYVFNNKIEIDNISENNKLKQFEILLIYDQHTNNFVPYTNDLKQYEMINSYKVTSTDIEITLKDNVVLENQFYTMRINRYDENVNISDKKNSNYSYKFEPIVTQMKDWNNNIVLEMKFENIYSLKSLKNIEIILGNE